MKINTTFDLLQAVIIYELDRPGIVTSIWIAPEVIQYKVRYFIDGKVNEVYFYDWELRSK